MRISRAISQWPSRPGCTPSLANWNAGSSRPALVQRLAHRGVNIHHVPAVGAFGQQPRRVARQVFIVKFLRRIALGILHRRRAKHDPLHAGFDRRLAQMGDRVGKPFVPDASGGRLPPSFMP